MTISSTGIKVQIVRALETLPPESLMTVAEFVEFLRDKVDRSSRSAQAAQRIVKMGGLWQGYSFTEEEIRTARREAWSGLGRDLDV